MRRRHGTTAAGENIHLRQPGPADLLEIAALIENLAARYLNQNLTDEGRALFQAAGQPGALGATWAGVVFPPVNPRFVAVNGARIVGYGAVRDRTHITQLFVADDHQGLGVGHRLVRALVNEVRARNPEVTEITLNSAPSALNAYFRMGFRTAGPFYTWRGISAQPMALRF
jgi:GNAT superfamily N-acetyltransferase